MDLKELVRRLGQAVRRRRLTARISQEELAGAARVHRTHVSTIERGIGAPTLAVIHKLATALEISVGVLLAETDTDAPPAVEPPEIPRGRPPRGGKKGPKAGQGA